MEKNIYGLWYQCDKMSNIKVINIDTVRELRARGKYYEANQLILAYQRNKKENLEQLKRELNSKQHKIYVHKNHEKVKEYQKEYHKGYKRCST